MKEKPTFDGVEVVSGPSFVWDFTTNKEKESLENGIYFVTSENEDAEEHKDK